MLGISNVTLLCGRGLLGSVVDMYRSVLDCHVEVEKDLCTVHMDVFPGQTLVYREVDSTCMLNAYDASESKRFHIAIYFETHAQFLSAFQRASSNSLLFVNERFIGGPIEFASSTTYDEIEISGQFRLKNFGSPPQFQIEHEVTH